MNPSNKLDGVGTLFIYNIPLSASSLLKPSKAAYNKTHHWGWAENGLSPTTGGQSGPDPDKAGKVI